MENTLDFICVIKHKLQNLSEIIAKKQIVREQNIEKKHKPYTITTVKTKPTINKRNTSVQHQNKKKTK